MKLTIISLGLSFILFSQFSFAQSWEWQHPKPQGHYLTEIFFLDIETGWAAGAFGTMMKTDDGGQNWILQDVPTEAWILEVFFLDKDHGWAFTDGSEVFYTEDEGENWTNLYNTDFYWADVHYFNADTGIVAGGVPNGAGQILRTEDGGLSWSPMVTFPNEILLSLSFLNDSTGWASGSEGLIIHTENGGLDWLEQNSGTDISFRDISFIDEQTGWAAGSQYLSPGHESKIFNTTDGGTSWSEQSVLPDVEVVWMEFISEDDGYLLAGSVVTFGLTSPVIFQTSDGGATWSSMDFGINGWLYQGFIIGDQDIWLVGENSRILNSNDNGASWTNQIEILSTDILREVQFLNMNEGWAIGRRSVLHTVNAGQDWQLVMPDTFTGEWSSLAFPDNQNGWLAGAKVIHTTNGGQDWEEQILPVDISVQKIFFTSPTTGWIIGYSDQVLSTTNGGQDWAIHDVPSSSNFEDIHFVDSQTGWIIGGSSIVSTTDGGQSWSIYDIGGSPGIRSVYFSDPLNGWVLSFGSDGIYYRTQDGGQTWQENTISEASYVLDVYFVTADKGWVVGVGGYIWHTEDGGDTWTLQESGTDLNLFDIYAVDGANAWTVGFNGSILKYTGIPSDTEEAPNALMGNFKVFPNPADNEINIVAPSPIFRYDAEIRSYTGQLIKSFRIVSQEATIPLDVIPTGVYFLNLIDGEKRFFKKILILKE